MDPGVATGPESLLERADRHRVRSLTSATSLSPRPESVISTADPAGIDLPASLTTHASAWAGSRAGMMPSVSDSSRKAAMTSSSSATDVLGPADRPEVGVFRTYARIVKTG